MKPIEYLKSWLLDNKDKNRYLFTSGDLRVLFPELSENAFRTLLSRAVKSKILNRLCKGLYLYEKDYEPDGFLLFHVAAMLRPHEFNYVSLETVLSESGIISQIPINYISIMSSGRNKLISCGDYGTIEFIHTSQKPENLKKSLVYDQGYGFWKADIKLAIRDMKRTSKNTDLINWDIANELI